MANRKSWWAPLRKGLVIGEPVHRNRMGSAVWLFLYLIENADRKTGALFRKMKTIAADMVTTRETVMRWIVILRREGYITTRSNGRSLSIRINKWRPSDVTGVKVDVSGVEQNKRQGHHFRSDDTPKKDDSAESRDEANLSANNALAKIPINNSIIKNSYNHISNIESVTAATPTPASRMREFISSEDKQKEVIDYLASKV